MQPSRPATLPDSRFRRIVRFPLVTLAIGLGCALAPSVLFQVAAARLLGLGRSGGAPGLRLLVTIGSVVVAFLAYRGFNRWVERRGNVELAHAGAVREMVAGTAAGLVLFSIIVGIIALLGGYHIVGQHPVDTLVPVLALAIGSGFLEELVFRGLIFRLVEQWLGSWAALAFSALLFGGLHLGNPHATLLAGVAIALEAGVMLAALYMLTRRLWAAIGLHMAWNFTQGGIFGIPVSGNVVPGLLIDRPAGPTLLTGGAFGAEASLPAIVIATGFGVALLVACARADRFVPLRPQRRAAVPAVTPL